MAKAAVAESGGMNIRVGQGVDVHAFAEKRRLVLGGVTVPYHLGLAGHSDADVLTHAICDALLGAACLGDLGHWFPDTDPRYRGADSLALLAEVCSRLAAAGWRIGNVDATLVAQRPRLAPYIKDMRKRLAATMRLAEDCVSIKATTSEHLGFAGRGEGMAALAVALIGRD